MKPATATTGRVALFLVTAFLTTVGAEGLTTPMAFAHGGPGKLAVTTATRTGDTLAYTLSITFVKDGHRANEASVVATLRDPSNRIVGAPHKAKKVKDGVYTVAVIVPKGAWRLRFASLRPTASLTVQGDDSTGAPGA